MLHLVRHARSAVSPHLLRVDWPLAPSAIEDVRRLRDAAVLPRAAHWYSSPERRAIDTARLLHDGQISVRQNLREQGRSTWVEDFIDSVERALRNPGRSANEGWETAVSVSRRLIEEVELIKDETGGDVVLVGHGMSLTLLVAALTHTEPDIEGWRDLLLPDHCALEGDQIISPWGAWTH